MEYIKTFIIYVVIIFLAVYMYIYITNSQVLPHKGSMAKDGGSPTIREPYTRQSDNPLTTNDESNDQPLGHYGTETMEVTSYDSRNTYTLDVDKSGATVERIYFPKGGWVDFYDCELEEDDTGECYDEEGRLWRFDGEGYLYNSSRVEEESSEEDDEENSEE